MHPRDVAELAGSCFKKGFDTCALRHFKAGLGLNGFGDPLGENGLTSDMLARCAYRLGVGDTTLRRLTQSLVPEANRIWNDGA